MIQSTTITVEGKISNTDFTVLEEYCNLSSTIYRKLYNIVNLDSEHSYNELQKTISKEYQVQVRVFKSLYIKATAQHVAQKELNKLYIKETESKIESAKSDIKKAKKPYRKHYLHQKENKLEQKLNKLENKETFPIVCGTKEFYKKQWKEDVDKEEWKSEWKRKRNHSLYFVGAACETCGNSICQMRSLESIRLTLPLGFKDKYLELEVDFNHPGKNYELFRTARNNGQPLTYTILQKENKKWYVQVSFTITSELDESSYNSSIGVDLNHNLIATTSIKSDGNPGYFKDYELDTENWSSERSDNEYSLIIKDIIERAKTENSFIVIEDLNLAKKRATPSSNKNTNRKIHMIATSKFYSLLLAACIKEKILLKLIDPAYTSVIGKYKYSKNLGISVHSSASYVIGRRGLGFRELVPRRILEELQSGENLLVKCESWKDVSKQLGKRYPKGFSLKKNIQNLGVNREELSMSSRRSQTPSVLETYISMLLDSV